MIRNYLDQDEEWTTADGRTLDLAEMTPAHRANLLRFLRRHAEQLKWKEELGLIFGPQPSGDAACDAFDSLLHELAEQDAEEWLEQTPLVRRLATLVAADVQAEQTLLNRIAGWLLRGRA